MDSNIHLEDMDINTENPGDTIKHKRSSSDEGAIVSKRMKIDFDFWKSFGARSDDSLSKKVDFQIIDITSGTYLYSLITFRVSLKQRIRETKFRKVFVFHGIDNTDEIAFIAFRDVAEKLEPKIQLNSVYQVENFKAKLENSNIRSTTGHLYEITLDTDSIITERLDMDSAIRNIFLNTDMDPLQNYAPKSHFDFSGILVKDFGIQTGFNGKKKRDLLFYTKTKEKILCTLWDIDANEFVGKEKNCYYVRKGIVSYDSTSVHIGRGTLLWENPPYDEAKELLQWFAKELESRINVSGK